MSEKSVDKEEESKEIIEKDKEDESEDYETFSE